MIAPCTAPKGTLSCPICRRPLTPGATWAGVNYCRGLALADLLVRRPGATSWELAQTAGVPFEDATRGLSKARGFGLIEVVAAEDRGRGDGSVRYRYRQAPDWRAAWVRLAEAHDVAMAVRR